MRALIWGNTFVRALQRTVRKYPALKNDIEETLRLLQENPFASQLATHKLKGKLAGSGEAVIITKDEQPVAELRSIPAGGPQPRFGSCKGMLTVVVEDEEHLEDFHE